VADNKIVLTYTETLDNTSTPTTTDYSLSGTSETVSAVVVDWATVTLTLSGDITESDTVLLSYISGANPIRDLAENDAANLTNQAITNNTSGSITADTTAITADSGTITADKI